MKSLTGALQQQQISPLFANAFMFSALCAGLFWIVDQSGFGFQIGMIWGGFFGAFFYVISRKINQTMGDGSAGLFTNGFSGTVAGTFAAFVSHLVFGPNLDAFIISIFGDMQAGVSQMAFYVMVEGAFLGGGFGVFQSLIMGKVNRMIVNKMGVGDAKVATEDNKLVKYNNEEATQLSKEPEKTNA
jgi:hypothetical protein